jgi:hypothetical protein
MGEIQFDVFRAEELLNVPLPSSNSGKGRGGVKITKPEFLKVLGCLLRLKGKNFHSSGIY